MTKLPYGGYELEPVPHELWDKLEEIAECLEKGEAVRPNLAYWLGSSIRTSGRNNIKLLINLGLKKKSGRQEKFPDGWLIYGQIICEQEDDGLRPEEALNFVHQQLYGEVERSTLQRWRDHYRKVQKESFGAHK